MPEQQRRLDRGLQHLSLVLLSQRLFRLFLSRVLQPSSVPWLNRSEESLAVCYHVKQSVAPLLLGVESTRARSRVTTYTLESG